MRVPFPQEATATQYCSLNCANCNSFICIFHSIHPTGFSKFHAQNQIADMIATRFAEDVAHHGAQHAAPTRIAIAVAVRQALANALPQAAL